ncbi:hypothetical protein PUMCH_002591 [Australozyma saopauloensis]|uniref:Uncharacterized protein n=1 Tax=Australozyma saopauloensis TaxID=291208 RepID=A0AAX4H9P2_9ASCO|nr:hypothetical protein PUMCH_002591 [[Candida] saopauloensis]
MTDPTDYSHIFLSQWFPKLPWTIVEDILRRLPAELISETLLHVPFLRKFIIELFYTNEIHLILSPARRPHLCVSDGQKQELIDITTFGEIDDFLSLNPDINPDIVKVIANQDFRSLEELLTKHRERFARCKNLQVYVDDYEFTETDLAFLFSFRNLLKFQTSRVKLRRTKKALSALMLSLVNLKDLVLLGHEVSNWSEVTFPSNLLHLDLSWYSALDHASVRLPESLEHLYWNQVGFYDSTFDSVAFPCNLKTLMLTYNSLHELNVSRLPQTLETLDLSANSLQRFVYDASNPRWPPMLESILLNNNIIGDDTLKQLQQIEWPRNLRNLRLDMNSFTTLEYLDTLPEGLTYLDLSDTALRTLEVKHNHDEYPYFNFPGSLDVLNIQCCRDLRYEARSSASSSVQSRIKFPENLRTLNMTEANCEDLGNFIFPKTLKSLSLAGNRIRDINSYNLTLDGVEIVHWSHLKNLRELDLFYNLISDLKNWHPPINLKDLSLRKNEFKILSSIDTPLFDSKFRDKFNIQVLNFDENQIHTLDQNLCLPNSVKCFTLWGNALSQFNFTKAIGDHPNLDRLDLTLNQIEKLSIVPSDAQYLSHLTSLDLTGNELIGKSMTIDNFYALLKQLDITPLQHKRNLKTIHVFK